MHLVRTLASYYRQNHLHLLDRRGLCGRQLLFVRRPEMAAFEQARRPLTALGPSPSDQKDGILAHANGVTKMELREGGGSEQKPPPPSPTPRKHSIYTWAKWALGPLLALFLPLWSTRWQRLLFIGSKRPRAQSLPSSTARASPRLLNFSGFGCEVTRVDAFAVGGECAGEVEKAVKVAETAAEVVEEVAAVAEKVSAEVEKKLPEEGKLEEAAVAVENASRAAVAGARTVEDIIHKVDELEQEVETLLKPVTDPTTTDHK